MERNGLKANSASDMLLAALDRERNASGINHLRTGSDSYDIHSADRHLDRAHSGLNVSNSSQPSLFPNPLDRLPLIAHSQAHLFLPYFASSLQASSRFPNPLDTVGSPASQARLPSVREAFNLKCRACGIACATISELYDHITRIHLAKVQPEERSASESELLRRRHSVSSVRSFKDESNLLNTQQRKSSAEASSSSKENDRNSPSDFPIPKPNFALFSSYGKLPSLNPAIGINASIPTHDPTKAHAESVLNPLLASQLKQMPLPIIPGAYNSMLNPFLAYQNLVNANGFPTTSSAPGKHHNERNVNPITGTGYPHLRPPAFPFLPGIPAMMPQASLKSTRLESNPSREKSSMESDSSMKHYDTTKEHSRNAKEKLMSSLPNLSFPSSHADSIRRRVSVPVISFNKQFRAPYPYSRKPSTGNNAPCGPIKEPRTDHVKNAYKNPMCHSGLSRKQMSLPEKPTSSRLNAKSIEQHISKLISNNEKVLLNPVLERVKPRRVFRRNSLDPASLASYAAAIPGRNLHDDTYLKDGEALKEQSKMFRESNTLPSSSNLSFPTSIASNFSLPLGLTPSEYEQAVQLRRLTTADPHLLKSLSGKDTKERAKPAAQHPTHGVDNDLAFDGILGKRYPSHSGTSSSIPLIKKPRRATVFECSDCGVRYRKEENYNIHKEMYCKFKNNRSRSTDHTEKINQHLVEKSKQFRRHSDLPEIPTGSLNPKLFEKHSFGNNSSDTKLVKESVSTGRICTTNTSVTLNSDLCANQVTFLHKKQGGKISRRQSDVSTSREKVAHYNQVQDTLETFDPNKPDKACSEIHRMSTSLSSTNSPVAVTDLPPQAPPSPPCPVSSIPANKLPPNKRHLMRHFEQDSSESTSVQHSQEDLVVTATPYSKQDEAVPSSNTVADPSNSSQSGIASTSVPVPTPATFSSSITPDSDPFSSPATPNVFTFDEAVVPRSDRSFSLPNFLLSEVPTAPDRHESVWSWEQIQKGFLCDGRLEPNSHSTQDRLRSSAQVSIRKFSVPSRLSQIAEEDENASLSVSRTDDVDKLKQGIDCSPTCGKSDNSASKDCSSTNVSEEPSKPLLSSRSDVAKQLPHILRLSDINNTKMELQIENVSRSTTTTEDARTVKSENNKMRHLAEIRRSHSQPALTARTHVSNCCMVNLQPSCMEIPNKKVSKNTQFSMYGEWADAKETIVSSDKLMAILSCWRCPKAGFWKGVLSTAKNNCQLILTENKNYKQFKENIKPKNSKKHDSSIKLDDDTTDDEVHTIKTFEKNENLTVPVLLPSLLVTSPVKPIYGCCDFSSSSAAATEWNIGKALSISTSTNLTNDRLKQSLKSYNITSGVKVPDSLPEPSLGGVLSKKISEKMEVPFKSTQIVNGLPVSDLSSGRDTGSGSDPVDVRIEFFGKVKRRRTRKQRTASSPRAKRRALQCQSPSSPKSLTSNHQDKTIPTEKNNCKHLSRITDDSVSLLFNPSCGVATIKDEHSSHGNPSISLSVSNSPVTATRYLGKGVGFSENVGVFTPNTVIDKIKPSQGFNSKRSSLQSSEHLSATASTRDRYGSSLTRAVSGEMCTATKEKKEQEPSINHHHQKPASFLSGDVPSPVSQSYNETSHIKRSNSSSNSLMLNHKTSTSNCQFPPFKHSEMRLQAANLSPCGTASTWSAGRTGTYKISHSSSSISSIKASEFEIPAVEFMPGFIAKDSFRKENPAFPEQVKYSPTSSYMFTKIDLEKSEFATTASSTNHGNSLTDNEADRGSDGSFTEKICVDDASDDVTHSCTRDVINLTSKATSDNHCGKQLDKAHTQPSVQSLLTLHDSKSPVARGQDKCSVKSENLEHLNKNSDACPVGVVKGEINDEPPPYPIDNLNHELDDSADQQEGSPLDPRPFKCPACNVGFRFQGHLYRHYRSNAHLIGVGHYQHSSAIAGNRSNHATHQHSCERIPSNEAADLPTSPDSSNQQPCYETGRKDSLTQDGNKVSAESKGSPKGLPSPASFPMLQSMLGGNGILFPPNYPSWRRGDELFHKDRRALKSPLNHEKQFLYHSAEDALTSKTLTYGFREGMVARDDIPILEEGNKMCRSGSKNSLNTLPNGEPVPQLNVHSNSHPNSSVTLRSSDCMSHKVVMPCQVSCT